MVLTVSSHYMHVMVLHKILSRPESCVCLGCAAGQQQRITAQAGTSLRFNPLGLNFGVTGRFAGATKNSYSFR